MKPGQINPSTAQCLWLAVLLLLSTTAGCGLLGSGDDGEDESFPEPPGRPSSSAHVEEPLPNGLGPAAPATQIVPS